MLTYYELRKGVQFIYEGQPYEVLDFRQMGKSQDVVVAQTKIKNLITGKIIPKNFHQGETFQEAELEKFQAKFVYENRGKFIFSRSDNPSNRFELTQEQLGDKVKFLVPNTVVLGLLFEEEFISVQLPIKMAVEVKEAPPGVQGDRASGGTKEVTLEMGAVLNVPLFVQTGDQVEVNTETGEYVRRLDKAS